jgi:dUTP pyrophosphatase
MSMKVLFQRCAENPDLPLPQRMTQGSAGFDLRACLAEPVTLEPRQRQLIPTGFRMALPPRCEGQIRPRSGLALRHGITLLNTPGTVDEDYRGEVKVLMINLGDEPHTVQHGDRIAQMVVASVTPIVTEESDELPATGRGEGGFGHTGSA